jgi:hypothetical protein
MMPNKALQLTRQSNGQFGVFLLQHILRIVPLEGGQLSFVRRRKVGRRRYPQTWWYTQEVQPCQIRLTL